MKIKISVKTNLRIKEVKNKIDNASERGLKDVLIDMAGDTVKGSPVATAMGGTNRRSIKYETKGLSGSIYSTSGYGGYLEVGTHNKDKSWRMLPRPYFRPAYDKNCKKLPSFIKMHLNKVIG